MNRSSAIAAVAVLAIAGSAAAESGPTQAELNDAARSTEWLLPNHDYAGVRFVDLAEITPANAKALRPVCQFQGADLTRSQTNPLVYRGVMYVTTTYATVALDPVTCRVKWRHDWKAKAKEGNTSIKNRGIALKDGKVVRGTQDGYLIALDAATGKLLWEVPAARPEKFEAIGMTPLAFEDTVIVGPNGSEYGVKGWIGAFRLSDGQPVWKFNTIPDDGEPAAESWGSADARLRGGGAIWTTPSLDAGKGLIYVPVGNPAPDFFASQRPGENLYTNTMVVLDARTGKLQWYKQGVPHDTHDWDLPVVSPLFTASVGGVTRDVVTMGGKDACCGWWTARVMRSSMRRRSRRGRTWNRSPRWKACTPARVCSAAWNGACLRSTRAATSWSRRRWTGAARSRARTNRASSAASSSWADRSPTIRSRNRAAG